MPGELAVKILDEKKGIIAGWGIPFGGPLRGKDLDGEYFSPDTDFCFEWFKDEGRPVLYHHGLDPEIGLERIGTQTSKRIDDANGVWVTAQLDLAHKYAEMILELAKKGVLGFSSGALGGYVRRAGNGKIVQWPWIEQTLTPIPANPYALIAPDAVKRWQGLNINVPETLLEAAKAVWDTAYIDALPDSAFAVIDKNGRHLPHHASGGAVDEPHLRNALSREPQTQLSAANHAKARAHLERHAKALGIGDSSSKALDLAAVADLLTQIDDAADALLAMFGIPDVDDNTVKAARMGAVEMDSLHAAMSHMKAIHAAVPHANCPMDDDGDDDGKSLNEFELAETLVRIDQALVTAR